MPRSEVARMDPGLRRRGDSVKTADQRGKESMSPDVPHLGPPINGAHCVPVASEVDQRSSGLCRNRGS